MSKVLWLLGGAGLVCTAAVYASAFMQPIILCMFLFYFAACALLWSNSTKSYSGVIYSLQCLAVFLLSIVPGSVTALVLVFIFASGDHVYANTMVWGVGMGAVFYGIPGIVLGLTILVLTGNAVKRRSGESP